MSKTYRILDFKYQHNGFEQHVYPVVLFGEKECVLIDCSYFGSLELLEHELERRM